MTSTKSSFHFLSSFLLYQFFLYCELSLGITGNFGVPVINIRPILDRDNPSYNITALAVHNSFQKYGLFIGINNFSNPASATDEEISSAKSLFSLSLQEKLAVKMNDSESFGRGYIPFGEEAGLAEFFESKEGYSYGYPLAREADIKANLLSSTNKWPSNFSPSDKERLDSLFLSKSLIAERLLEAVFSIFDKSTSTHSFSKDGRTISLMRLFHYSPINNVSESMETDSCNGSSSTSSDRERIRNRTLGSSPHTDWGLLTVITDNSVAGLQFLHNDIWVDVILPKVTGAAVFVVNAGDYLELLTNHYYHSPVHRVLSPTIAEGDRYSAVFFYYPNYDSPLNLFHRSPSDETTISSCQYGDGDGGSDSMAEGCSQQEDKEANLKFNTLLKLSDTGNTSSTSNITFGDYIMRKWKGVISAKES